MFMFTFPEFLHFGTVYCPDGDEVEGITVGGVVAGVGVEVGAGVAGLGNGTQALNLPVK